MISGVGYTEKDGMITFMEFCNQWQSFLGKIRISLSSHDELFTSIAEEITENDGNPYIEQNKENDEIDRSRIDTILAHLGKMSNAEFSEFTRANIPDKRYWDWNRSKFDVAQYIIDNDVRRDQHGISVYEHDDVREMLDEPLLEPVEVPPSDFPILIGPEGERCGYKPYIIKDMGRFSKEKVEMEFDTLIEYLKVNGTQQS